MHKKQATTHSRMHTTRSTRHKGTRHNKQDTYIAKTPNARHKTLYTRYNKETEDPRTESRRRRRYID